MEHSVSNKQLLNPVTLPLQGKHLIEASAGTGKTFNITRLYLRALLELDLSVEQILVMTFSNAATEEIRGRIAQTLSEAIIFWQSQLSGNAVQKSDPVYLALYQQHANEVSLKRLEAALLVIDEAAIYTIHGFCQQVLSTYAFDTGFNLNAQLHTDNSQWLDTCTKDWLRSLRTHSDALESLAEFGWHTPEGFLKQFSNAINSSTPLVCRDEHALVSEPTKHAKQIQVQFLARFTATKQHVIEHRKELFAQLVVHKKADTQRLREQEWQGLLDWLEAAQPQMPGKAVENILHGRRYTNNELVKQLMMPLKALKAGLKKALDKANTELQRKQQQQQALSLAYQGILHIKQSIDAHKEAFSILEFDDLITGVANAVTKNAALATELERKYPIALVDEFQDTDAAQYQLLRCIYTRDDSALLMIGDPKQAIYGFRGGDIFTYLSASEQVRYAWFMDTNWRSTQSMINAYNGLFTQADFDFSIEYLPVNASPQAKVNETCLYDPIDDPAAMRLVYCSSNENALGKAELKTLQAAWLANEIGRLLTECRLGQQAFETKDIAVLVRNASDANVVSTALQQADIAHVYLSNQQSVYQSEEAKDILLVLSGIFHNNDHKRMSAALTSPLLGRSAEDHNRLFVAMDTESWDLASNLVANLKRVWQQKGVLALLQNLIDDYLFVASTVQENEEDEGLERSITNYQHLAELLQLQVEQQGIVRVEELLSWLTQQIDDAKLSDESAIQRLQKDENAVQIVTQHKSKGLEYPVVFIPFASDYKDPTKIGRSTSILCQYYHEERATLVQQLGDTTDVHARMTREGEAEAMRLLYVAITRAMQRCYILLSPFDKSHRSAIGRALLVANETEWCTSIERFCLHNNSDASFTMAPDNISVCKLRQAKHVEALSPPFTGHLNRETWQLVSFSSLLSTNKNWYRSRSDEMSNKTEEFRTPSTNAELPMRFLFPKGAAAGNVLHDLLEHKDFMACSWPAESEIRVASLDNNIDVSQVLVWLDDVLAMPIQLAGQQQVSLNTIAHTHSLREAEFYFPLASVATPKLMKLATELRTKTLQTNNASTSVAPVVLPKHVLQGMMHGFIDLIFQHQGKYYVADYKSNYMGSELNDYSIHLIAQNLIEHNYDVQALIYCVALHRYLQKRLPDYEPSKHFGGAIYLYLRGMSQDNTENQGVVNIPIDAELIVQLDTMFAGDCRI